MTVERPLLDPRSAEPAEAFRGLLVAAAHDGFRGWDPYDALTSPLLRTLARTPLMERAFLQGLKRSPVNVRPLLGVRRLAHTKGLALFLSASRRAPVMARPEDLDVDGLATILAERASTHGDGLAWGYDFDVATRWGVYAAREPNAVATAFVAQALLDAGGEHAILARDAMRFACSNLFRHDGTDGYFAYTRASRVPIHNASLLLVGVGARCLSDEDEGWEICRSALNHALRHQRPDGSWPYGEWPGLDWVDGFHTGYVLQALAEWQLRWPEARIDDAIKRGADFYAARLIDPDGAPRATIQQRLPIESHAAGTAISTFARLSRLDREYLHVSRHVLDFALDRLRRTDARFIYRIERRWRVPTPYIRWSDGHMALGLADFLEQVDG